MKRGLICLALFAFLTVSTVAVAGPGNSKKTITVIITNITNGIVFTPLLVATHKGEVSLFELGEVASAALEANAELGDTSGLAEIVENAGGNLGTEPSDSGDCIKSGLLFPGDCFQSNVAIDHINSYLSIVAMLLPTNDGFVGLNSYKISNMPGTTTLYLNGYDAGTEANNELLTGDVPPDTEPIDNTNMPGNPSGNGGTDGVGVDSPDENDVVHIHPGNIGDTNLTGGESDLDSRFHRWLNPVAKVVIAK